MLAGQNYVALLERYAKEHLCEYMVTFFGYQQTLHSVPALQS